jgi:hypothetical protein
MNGYCSLFVEVSVTPIAINAFLSPDKNCCIAK